MVHACRGDPATATEWADVFDDTQYGKEVVSIMHRGDTIDSATLEPAVAADDDDHDEADSLIRGMDVSVLNNNL